MKKLIILISAMLLLSTKIHADILEMSVGTTFNRSSLGETGNILNLAYIITDHKYPIEYSISHITGSKNHSNGLNKDQTYVNLGLRKYRGKLFFGFGFGLGLVSETNDRLSTAFNFKSELGYTFKHVVLKVAHISNADIKRPNDGENIVTIGYRKEL